MDTEQYHTEFEDDTRLGDSDLGVLSIETTTLYSKWSKYLTKEAYKLKRLDRYLEALEKQKYAYYMGWGSDADYIKRRFDLKLSKAETLMYVKGDKEIIQHKLKIDEQQILVDALDGFLGMIRYRHSMIRNSIDFLKYTAGDIG